MLIHGLLLMDPDAPPAPGWIRVESGRIVEFELTGEAPPDIAPLIGGPGRLIIPGFIDAHTHPPQFDCIGCDGMPLLQWLETVIYPAETWWGRGAARALMRRALRDMLLQGTVGFAGYLTSHAQSAHDAIAAAKNSTHMRMLVGRVAMDRGAPDSHIVEDQWRAQRTPRTHVALPDDPDPRVDISINPRFAPTCSDELLAECGWAIEDRPDLWTQTHLAESIAECELVRSLFPDHAHYTAVYDRSGLLNLRTLLAHCVHLVREEWELIAERQSVVVHCPTANLFLNSGLFDLDTARSHDVRFALGSDVGAGPDVAMPRVARAMIETAKTRKSMGAGGRHVPTPAEAFRCITSGNADALGWSDCGRIAKGAWADLLILNIPESWHDEHLIGRLLYAWSPTLIEHRVIAGSLADPATI